MKIESKWMALIALGLAGCATSTQLPQGTQISCTVPAAIYPDLARPLTRPVTVFVRALITASGQAENVTITTSSRNPVADRVAADAMARTLCTETPANGGGHYPFTLTQPFVFQPAVTGEWRAPGA